MIFISILFITGLLAFIYNLDSIKEYIRYRRLISKLPGPKTYSILGNIPDLLYDQVTLFKIVRRWGQEHYPVYRLSLGPYQTANVVSPEDFEAIASTTRNVQKHSFYKFGHLWIGDGILCSSGSKWQVRRKILTPAFHFNILQQFIEIFVNHTDHLVNALREVSHKPSVNVVPYLAQLSLRILNETSMGIKSKLEDEELKSFCTATNEMGKIFAYRLIRPWLYFNWVFYNFSQLGDKEKRMTDIIKSFTAKVIRERAKDFKVLDMSNDANETFNYFKRKKKLVLLDVLLNAKISSNIIDDEGIQEEVKTFMFAGYDTASTAMSFILMLLAQHKSVQELILDEINKVLMDPARPTFNELQELKYMERCIKECMRLYPPAPLIGRVLEDDITTSHGYILPKGTMVQIHIIDIHRNPRIWPDPERFDPDRFLPENCVNRHPFAYVPFSAGPRNCIGQRYAVLEIKVALCGIVRNFKLEPVDTPENISLIPHALLSTKNGSVNVKLIPRE